MALFDRIYASQLTNLTEQAQDYAEKLKDLDKEKEQLNHAKEVLRENNSKVLRHYEKSIEYRKMLQEYQRVLRERDDQLTQREKALKERESKLISLTEKYKSVEYNALVTLNRWDNKEREYLSFLNESNEKTLMYPSIVHRRNGFSFETHIAKMLEANGFVDVEVTKKSGDFGADIIGYKDGVKHVFQCKYYSQPVGIHAVQEALGAEKVYNADKAVVVTNNVFTKAAYELANSCGIELWDCSTLAKLNITGEFI